MFNYRHRRVLESIFYHHPTGNITLHSNFLVQDDFKQFTDAGYALRVANISFQELAAGTPLDGAVDDPKWQRWQAGRHWYTSFSNVYRLLVLWKLGGIYIDTDMLVTKPFRDLDRVVSYQDPARRMLNNAVLVFKAPGNPYVWRCLVEISTNYSTALWGANGPSLVSRVWRRWNATDERDAAVRVVDSESFFLFLHSQVHAHCFNDAAPDADRAAYARALAARAPFAVHLANKMSGKHVREIRDQAQMVRADLRPATFCHYLLTRFCLFCRDAPRRPISYPPVEANGTRFDLP
jgi:lactosylceramide 4-alpha-galactosyltransferase